MKAQLKRVIRSFDALEELVTRARALPFERRMSRDIAVTSAEARRRGVKYSEDRTRRLVKERLSAKGIDPRVVRRPRIFSAWVNHGWETEQLRPCLQDVGDLCYVDLGQFSSTPSRPSPDERSRMNSELFRAFREALRDGLDVALTYVSSEQIDASVIERISQGGVPVVNMSLDDDIAFGHSKEDRRGVAPIANSFDLCWTSFRPGCERFLLQGAIPLWCPQAANPRIYRPLGCERDRRVSFVGKRYGMRPIYVAWLRRHGVHVECYGADWERGFVGSNEANELINRSEVNLGFGGRMFSDRVVNLKGRDFEVPMAGGLYLTQYTPGLEQCYALGEEIVCYQRRDDLLSQLDALLSDAAMAEAIRRAGAARARRSHTWQHRFRRVFELVGVHQADD